MTRVLHILGDSAFGGGSRIVLQLCAAARSAGLEPSVLTTNPTFQRHCDELSIPVVNLPGIVRPIHPWRDWTGERRLHRHLRDERIEIAHTHTSKAGIIGRRAAWRAGVPVVIHTVHGFAFHEQSPAWIVRLYAAIERLAARWCHRLVTVSEFHRDWAESLGIAHRPHVMAIPNGIEPAPSATPEQRSVLRAEFKVAPDQLLVVSAGRLAAGKGLEDLLYALTELTQPTRERLRVVLPGAGPLASTLLGLVKALGLDETVCLPGFRDDVREILGAADLAVLPTHREGLSIALLEAMAAGLPVITTTLCSNREVTRDGMVARLHEPGDRDALARELTLLATRPEVRFSLGDAAREVFDNAYTAQRMLDSYIALYRELLAARPGGS